MRFHSQVKVSVFNFLAFLLYFERGYVMCSQTELKVCSFALFAQLPEKRDEEKTPQKYPERMRWLPEQLVIPYQNRREADHCGD